MMVYLSNDCTTLFMLCIVTPGNHIVPSGWWAKIFKDLQLGLLALAELDRPLLSVWYLLKWRSLFTLDIHLNQRVGIKEQSRNAFVQKKLLSKEQILKHRSFTYSTSYVLCLTQTDWRSDSLLCVCVCARALTCHFSIWLLLCSIKVAVIF